MSTQWNDRLRTMKKKLKAMALLNQTLREANTELAKKLDCASNEVIVLRVMCHQHEATIKGYSKLHSK